MSIEFRSSKTSEEGKPPTAPSSKPYSSKFSIFALTCQHRYPLTHLASYYLKKEPSKIIYLSEDQRKEFQCTIKENRLLDKDGNPVNGHGQNLIYVMDHSGTIYVHAFIKDVFHHSSFLAGAPVLCAGEIFMNEHGHIFLINNRSGHYVPNKEALRHILQHLQDAGGDLSQILVKLFWGRLHINHPYIKALDFLKNEEPMSPPSVAATQSPPHAYDALREEDISVDQRNRICQNVAMAHMPKGSEAAIPATSTYHPLQKEDLASEPIPIEFAAAIPATSNYHPLRKEDIASEPIPIEFAAAIPASSINHPLQEEDVFSLMLRDFWSPLLVQD